jgi:hypothetical protein
MTLFLKIKRFTPNLFKYESDLLKGRWNIDYDDKVLNRKIYLTNMDNCGCCGNIKKEGNEKINNTDEDLLKYYII